MASYERINYGLRPAKTIERKMLADTFRRLATFGNLSSYRYVGFGSTYFSDFIAFHRALNITNMISVEKDEENAERFDFNVPFKCVKMEYGYSTQVLPRLKWKTRTIAWLDYDGPLTSDVLADVAFFAANAPSGSALVISVNVNTTEDDTADETEEEDLSSSAAATTAETKTKAAAQKEEMAAAAERRLQRFKSRVGHKKVPATVTAKEMRGWALADLCKRIINNEIHDTLRARNGALDGEDRFTYSQLFNFHYADGAKMLTVGGIFYTIADEKHFRAAMFDKLSFVRSNGDAYRIDVPNLTYREIRNLERQMPCAEGTTLRAPGVPAADIERYRRVYRFFPTFAETEV